MAEYGTDSIQAIVNVYPRFDGKDTTQFMEHKDKLRVSLSFHRQASPPFIRASRSRQPHKIRRPLRRARTRTFSASCSSRRSVLPTMS